MFNVTVIDGKKIVKLMLLVVIVILMSVFIKGVNSTEKQGIKQTFENATKEIHSHSYIPAINTTVASIRYLNSKTETEYKQSLISSILDSELSVNNRIVAKNIDNMLNNETISIDDQEEILDMGIPDNLRIQVLEEKNLQETYTNTHGSVEIKNKSGYELTEEILTPNINIENKKDIIIFHTHTCESYTPTENYNYQMTGNYRTTDLNYTVARVGDDLTEILKARGYNVIHNTTMHDFPSYSGSYSNSMETVSSILNSTNAQVIIDLHRDAVGDGTTYGPTVKINDEIAAQLMIVVGTDAGGLEHPNWKENLKFAVKLQAKANEMYPGLFRPINLSTSRYNQHLSNGSIIIEVGATANTMEQSLASMKYLASVIDEVMKEE